MKRAKSDNDQRFVLRSPDAQYELPESEWLVHDGGKSLYQALLNYRAPWEQLRDVIDKVPSAEWVAQSQIWREWVRRDFPAAYELVTRDAPPHTMSQMYKRHLGGVSRADRREVDATLWKRYYELLSRPVSSVPPDVAKHVDVGALLAGRNTPVRFFKATSLQDSPAVLYIVPQGTDGVVVRLFRYPNTLNVIEVGTVPRSDPERLGALTPDALLNIDQSGAATVWKSIDGFTVYALVLHLPRQLMLYYAQVADITSRPLISARAPIGARALSCASCAATNVQLYQCSACATNELGYCGAECQAQHWPQHRDVCSIKSLI